MRNENRRSAAFGAVAAVAVAALAVNRWLVGREAKEAEPDEGGRVAGAGVHVVEEGPEDGPALVLLHGFGGSLRWFDCLAPLLAGDHRLIRIDLLGHGGSAKPATEYSIEEQAALVSETLAELGCERAVLVGHAMGAAVAVAVAESSPDLVERLGILNEGPDNSFVSSPLLARLGFMPVIGELLHRVVSDGMVRDGYRDAFAPGFDLAAGFADPDRVVADFRRMTYSSYKRSWAQEDAYLGRRRLDERLRDLGLPALVVFGAEDRFFRAAESADEFRRIPGAQVEMLPGAGHSPNVEQPEGVARLVLGFAQG